MWMMSYYCHTDVTTTSDRFFDPLEVGRSRVCGCVARRRNLASFWRRSSRRRATVMWDIIHHMPVWPERTTDIIPRHRTTSQCLPSNDIIAYVCHQTTSQCLASYDIIAVCHHRMTSILHPPSPRPPSSPAAGSRVEAHGALDARAGRALGQHDARGLDDVAHKDLVS